MVKSLKSSLTVRNETISYKVDHVYMFDESSVTSVMPGGFNVNGGFEFSPASVFNHYGAWSVSQNAKTEVSLRLKKLKKVAEKSANF